MATTRALEGRTAIVTGASRGIGRAIALLFADAGADVVLVARTQSTLDDVFEQVSRSGGRAVAVAADLGLPETPADVAARALSEFGRIDVLVNNAGGNSFMVPLADMRFSGWEKTMRLNLDSTVRMIQAVLPTMTEQASGSIINVSSVTGLRGSPLMSHYGAAKAAVISLTQSLAIELGTTGVRANALVPGWIATDLTDFLRDDEGLEHSLLDRVPMKRWGRPQEIAEGALFLAGDASSFMTGQSLILDGGLSVNP
ncbi:MAG: glucose 1-dehydrogenase [Actinomycetales bacterium]|nr:glucose 1-dehydrogenase [Actinomycetales bacterium]